MRQAIYPGLGPQLLEGPGSGSGAAISQPFEAYQTPLLDLTKTYANIELLPARPGFYPAIFTTAPWMIESHTGTQTTPPTIQAGNDVAHQNLIALAAASPSNATVNASNGPYYAGGVPTLAAFTTQKFPGATTYLDITSPAIGTGGFTLFARLIVMVIWIPVDGT